MASSLKNVSALLSPKFLSPLSSPKNFVGVSRSDGKAFFKRISRSNVAKKLEFPENIKRVSSLEVSLNRIKNLPDIKIEKVADAELLRDKSDNFDSIFSSIKSSNTLDINTPNKLDLTRNGLENFKRNTTVLGKGTFGTVFKGQHKGNTVAVKIVTKEGLRGEENALKLNHRNIVRTLEIIRNIEHQNYCLIMMEYLPNCKNLQNVLGNFHTDHTEVQNEKEKNSNKNFCLDITRGVNYCHTNGILHLDLKPKNILVTSENVCKICDFGNCVKIGENMASFKYSGTVMYTAPEILQGKNPSIKSDIYSLGLIFWQIKYRRNPFQSYDSNESIIYNVGKHNVRPLYEDKNPDLLTKIFTKCWESNPELRPYTTDILKSLENAEF